ncbi:MAG: hypothetical protein B6U76_03110 [Desulfurococcales archaeon ex4484_217_2]|nr:MAG: hypothetical protein B6U76_03110 [Desulfurococcales archaeon ex4484_217_2]
MQIYKFLHLYIVTGVFVSIVYMFEARVIKMGSRYYIYPPKRYQDKIARLHGKKVKILLVCEKDNS